MIFVSFSGLLVQVNGPQVLLYCATKSGCSGSETSLIEGTISLATAKSIDLE